MRLVLAGLLVAALALAGCSGSSGPAPTGRSTGTAVPTARPTGTAAASAQTPNETPAAPATDSAATAAYYRQTLSWHSCGGSSRGLDCATLHVPLDYADASSRQIDIALIRRPATSRTQRIGTLVVNPGGPGGSGVDFVASGDFSANLRAHFDIVGFDPRGVGRSAPVHCVDSAALDRLIHDDPSPDDAAEQERLVADNRSFGQACARQVGTQLLAHVGTIDTARDMDVLRAALGERTLTYLGYSYGTFLGAKYAELFPTRIRALVLDGAFDPALTAQESARVQAAGFETDLADFLADCARAGGCPVTKSSLLTLLATIDATGLPAPNAPGDRRLGPGEAFLGLAAGLYSPSTGWPELRTALSDAVHGDGSVLLELSDALVDRSADGSYSNQVAAGTAIDCVDRPAPRAVSTYQADAAAWAPSAPVFGAAEAWGDLACAFWPVPAAETPHPVHAPGAPPILVVGTTHDPATPYVWAQALASELDSGRLLTRVGDGHTAYSADGNACIRSAVENYLIQLALPPVGTRCD